MLEGTFVVGMDPSLRGFGISDGERHEVFSSAAGVPVGDRVRSLVNAVGAFITRAEYRPMLWVVEAPMLRGIEGGSHLYEIGWLMCALDAHARNLRAIGDELIWLEVPTSSLRKWQTGKGNAGKIDFVVSVSKKYGLDLGPDPGGDKAFAYALHRYGLAVLAGDVQHEFSAPRGKGKHMTAAVRKTARTWNRGSVRGGSR